MQVWHGFTTIRAIVDDQSVAAIFQTNLVRDFSGFEQEMAKQLVVFRHSLGNTRNHPLGEKQNVHRSLRMEVADGEDEVVFKNNLRRNFPRIDFFKKGFAHGNFRHELH